MKELIKYVLDRPSVAIDKGDKKVIHANRRAISADERGQWQGRPPSLHTDTKPAGANGASARSLTSGDIISQNSAKDELEIKTYANPRVGAGLACGTLNAKDENENFDAEKFTKGFIYGLFGSKVTAEQGSKLEQAEAKQEVVKGEAKNQQFNNTNVDYTSAVKNIVERKELALRLDPKADILSVVKDFSKPIKTPIFTSKISVDKMLNHLADKIDGDRRLEYINLVKPTLEKPLFITQESINGAQRFRFFKTFIDEKDKVVKFLNVVEDKNGELIEITATPIKNTDLKNLLKGKVIWGGDTLSDLSTPQTAKQGSEADNVIISQNSAKEARYRKTRFSEARVEDNGGVGGWEYKRTPAGYDKNYNADFLITKADVAKIRGGKIDEQGSKIEQAGAK
ncbi:PBECR2 nuclease fold domain-containing protein [uncultured Campylobacter sp.]|uniref:PBECR2 nuclease fold domain-containing protein n=1 Tax=uncultured Campylobacter sp. TaxID=218934 RepID=UPI003211C1B1